MFCLIEKKQLEIVFLQGKQILFVEKTGAPTSTTLKTWLGHMYISSPCLHMRQFLVGNLVSLVLLSALP